MRFYEINPQVIDYSAPPDPYFTFIRNSAAKIEAVPGDARLSLERALKELRAETWFSGLRRVQSQSRANTAPIEFKRGRYKVHPIFDWTDRDVGMYLQKHGLPYHPLWDKGYLSIGDWHTTRSLAEVDSVEELRFFGLKRECGLHEG